MESTFWILQTCGGWLYTASISYLPPQILISFVKLHSFHIFLNCIVIHMLHRLKPKNHPSRGGSFVINKNYPRWWELVRRLPGRRADRKAISGNYQLNTLTGNESIRSVESNSILETQRCSYDCLIVASSNIHLVFQTRTKKATK